MGQAFLLQDWTFLSSSAASSSVVQNDEGWLDMSGFTDVCSYISVRTVSGTPTLELQTSPSRDPDLFGTGAASMVQKSAMAAAITRDVNVVRFATATEPLARWVRWQVSGTNWTIMLRIYLVGVATS